MLNDGKQINILTGQGSCYVGYPMPCCMVHNEDLGRPPYWIILHLRQTVWSLPLTITDKAVGIISQFVGKPVYPDQPTREGEFSFKSTHGQWKRLTVDDKYTLRAEKRKKANKQTGSSLNEPIFNFPCKKNCGITHDPAGHIAHFMNKVSDSIRKKMEGCAWQLRMMSIDAEVKSKIVDIKTARKSSTCLGQSNAIVKRIRQIRKEKKDCLTRALSEVSAEVISQFK